MTSRENDLFFTHATITRDIKLTAILRQHYCILLVALGEKIFSCWVESLHFATSTQIENNCFFSQLAANIQCNAVMPSQIHIQSILFDSNRWIWYQYCIWSWIPHKIYTCICDMYLYLYVFSVWWKTVTEGLKMLPEAADRGQHFRAGDHSFSDWP